MLPVGTQLGPYKILALVGRGGMGEVYRALDVRLERQVAMKILPAQLAHEPDRLARFRQEAKAAAALAHPNILVLHDVGDTDGIHYAVTELLHGVTLREQLRSGPIPWREAIEFGLAIANGLAAAHAQGIIHRDIKPENVFLTTDGRLKILDFGLARLAAPARGDVDTKSYACHTAPGAVVGTLAYMSPEQLRGFAVDQRSDIFSLGCLLYELITGARAFSGETAADVSAAILHSDPAPLDEYVNSVPASVGNLLARCMDKAAAQRFTTTHELQQALADLIREPEKSSSGSGTRRSRTRSRAQPSLAVMPLVNGNNSNEMEYLSDGITESLIQNLSQLPGLRVMARSTVFRYKAQDIDPTDIGKKLGVTAVLLGGVRQCNNRLIIKVELVNARDGSLLWGERYDREMSSVLAIEREISQTITEKLRLKLAGKQRQRAPRPATQSTEAYQLYLRGRYHWNKRTAEGLKKSIKLFEKAIDVDPGFALAYTGVADAYLNLGGWGHVAFREAYPRAKAAAIRALEIDETQAEAHVSLAMVYKEYDWDWASAGREYQRGLLLNPNYAVAHQWYGEYLAGLGRHEEAITEFKRAIDSDPLSLIINATLGRHGYYFARQYDAAVAELEKVLELDEYFWVARLWLGWTYAGMHQYDKAAIELERARTLDGNLEILGALGFTFARISRRQDAVQILNELDEQAKVRHVDPMVKALVTIGLGDHDRSFELLEAAYEHRSQMLSELKVETVFDELRSDPRFEDLLRRVGLAS